MGLGRPVDFLKRFVFNKNVTPRKLVNFCLVGFQHGVLKNSRVVGHPVELVIDPSNICNCRCPLCPTGQGRNERPRGTMPLANFKKIIDEMGAYLYSIDLHDWGEPLVNEDIFDIIRYARAHNVKVNLSSNFNLSDDVKAEKLIRSGLDHLIISLSGIDQPTYQKYHVKGNIDKVMTNTAAIVNKKRELQSRTPSITWRFLVMKHNEHQIAEVKRLAGTLGVGLELMAVHGDMGWELFWNEEKRLAAAADWLPSNRQFGLSSMKPCSFLWVQAVINCDGSVSPCCAVYPASYDFGNMFTEGGFMKIWNNDKYRTARRIIRQKKAADSKDMENVCAHCLVNTKKNT